MSHDEAKTDPPRDAVVQGVVITSQLVAERGAVEFALRNGGSVPVWVPQEKQPSYRVDAAGKRIIVSYGYFEDVYGPHREHYMIPPMVRVAPGEEHRWELQDPAIVDRLKGQGFAVEVRARVALREIVAPPVRGRQPLDAYLQASTEVLEHPAR